MIRTIWELKRKTSRRKHIKNYVEPPIKKLINIIKTLIRKCYVAEKQAKQVTMKMTELYQGKERLKSANLDLRMSNRKISVEVRNFQK